MSKDSPSTLRISTKDSVRTIELARPEVHDAFDDVMVGELRTAFSEVAADEDIRVVILRSSGNHFCAGADLNWMRRMADYSPEENVADAGALDDMLSAIADCPKPVVVRVQGAALGGGAGLVAAADLAIGSERARLGFTEVRLGILPAVISPYVMRKLSPGVAQALFLTGEHVGAERALALGLLHRVVKNEDLDAAVDSVVADLLKGSPHAQASIKPLVAKIRGLSASEARGVTTQAIADARASSEGRHGMSTFLEKRRPNWSETKGDTQ